MTLKKRLQVGTLSLICAAAMAAHAAAETPATPASAALSSDDAERYVAAFQDVERGDFIDAQVHSVDIKDKSLLGYLSFRQLMHPTAHKAAFGELSDWLAKFRDLPVADRIFALAAKRKPADAADPPQPTLLIGADPAKTAGPPLSDLAQKARDAYFAGDLQRALDLAPAAGQRFVAGLAAYRLKAFDQAEAHFAAVARDEGQDAWSRAAGAFWAARTAERLGETDHARSFLRAAAQSPDTFYGMIAGRRLRLTLALPPAPPSIDSLIQAAYRLPAPEVAAFMRENDRAHRAAALAQIGRLQECGEELRAGLALAQSDAERAHWAKLAETLGVGSNEPAAGAVRRIKASLDYPMPELTPRAGFTLDKALVYAIVRQESGFNPDAVSPKGAVGLMQLMPESAARAAGDDKLRSDTSPLFDPSFNLRVGQDYLNWLMQAGMGHDLLKVVAAYNGGPGLVSKTAQAIGADSADDLLLIESIPAFETRAYVQKVVAGYWTYRQLFGQDSRTLDALAAGARDVDARLDLTEAASVAQLTAKPLQVGMR
ncbi:lytic transglycosylase domain-containing protein [Phenylobacterium sp.]|uniref:lytic transglycosylase domain-containing protein n=1 Tax=Phenylobacterium sp. TaxID=1871053 RepID=UPI002DF09A4E|nr:lytic transglycosylase domain-containing protein [Phenylobacterium sp.]